MAWFSYKPHPFRVGLVTLFYDLVMTAYYQYCRMGEKGGANVGGSVWQVDRMTDRR
jgi:hypothetical protein